MEFLVWGRDHCLRDESGQGFYQDGALVVVQAFPQQSVGVWILHEV